MNLNAYTLIVTYFMASLGLAAISLVESIGAAFTLAMAGAAAFTLALNLKGRRVIPGAIWILLAVLVFAFFVADYLAFSGSLIVAAGRFLTILLVLKLFDLERNRDFVIAYAIVFFQILSAAASTSSPLFLLILSLFIIGAIWAMILFNMKRDYQEANPAEGIPEVAFGGPFLPMSLARPPSRLSSPSLSFYNAEDGIRFFPEKNPEYRQGIRFFRPCRPGDAGAGQGRPDDYHAGRDKPDG